MISVYSWQIIYVKQKADACINHQGPGGLAVNNFGVIYNSGFCRFSSVHYLVGNPPEITGSNLSFFLFFFFNLDLERLCIATLCIFQDFP